MLGFVPSRKADEETEGQEGCSSSTLKRMQLLRQRSRDRIMRPDGDGGMDGVAGVSELQPLSTLFVGHRLSSDNSPGRPSPPLASSLLEVGAQRTKSEDDAATPLVQGEDPTVVATTSEGASNAAGTGAALNPTANSSDAAVIVNEATLRQEKRARKRARRIVGVSVHLLTTLLILSLSIRYLPTISLPDWSLLRGVLRNDQFSFSNLVIWHVLLVSGFMFVAHVTEKRPNPFLSRRGHYREILKLLATGPLLFFVGPVFTMAIPKADPQSFSTNWTEDFVSSLLMIDTVSDAQTLTFVYNYLFFIVPYYVGLHATFMDKNLFLRAVGDKLVVPSRWKTYTYKELIALAVLITLLLAIAVLQLVFLALDGILLWYVLGYSVILVAVGVMTIVRLRTHELHAHHYFFGLVLIPLCRTFNPISSCIMAASAGVYVEGAFHLCHQIIVLVGHSHPSQSLIGISRWSMASLWDRLP